MKRHGVFCALLCVMSCMAAEECQMLLPEAKQKEILGGRRYPQSSRRRISSAAVRDGFAALGKKDLDGAMREFNRAWRFDPKNPAAYWGAAILFGMKADAEKSPSAALDMIEASLKLFQRAEVYLPDNAALRENWQFDYASSLFAAGNIRFVSDRTAAEKYFADAEKIWLALLENRDLQKQRDKMVYCRACMHLTKLYETWDKRELQTKYREKLSAEIQKDPSLRKHLQLY